MSFEIIENVLNIKADAIMTTAMAAILLLVGFAVKSKVGFLRKYCIPAPVVGGFLFMFVTFAGHVSGTFKFTFDSYFQSPFMLAFFTTVGLGASLKILKQGGKLLFIYWLISGIISIFQNAIGVGVSKVVGLEAPYGLLASAISMIGGHGAAAAYGQTFYEMGYTVAPEVGAASATFGLISAVMLGGPLARKLITKYDLKPNTDDDYVIDVSNINASTGESLTSLEVLQNVTALLVSMAIGTIVSGWIGKLIGMSFPTYVGAMFVAMIVRNLNEKFHWYKFSFSLVDGIGDVMLSVYLSIAMMTLKLWEMLDLFGGVLAVLGCQVLFMGLVCYFIVFPLLGKNFDAAVMCAGLCGHGLGATPTAMVNLNALKERYGTSRKAFMIVPIVGAFLVDVIYQPQTVAFIKFFVQGFNG